MTKEYALPKDKLLITVYIDDDDAFKLWKKIAGFPTADPAHGRQTTISGPWARPAPAAPAREIFYDHGPHIPGGPPGSPTRRRSFIEIWNLVFMQYEQRPGGKRMSTLPRRR